MQSASISRDKTDLISLTETVVFILIHLDGLKYALVLQLMQVVI